MTVFHREGGVPWDFPPSISADPAIHFVLLSPLNGMCPLPPPVISTSLIVHEMQREWYSNTQANYLAKDRYPVANEKKGTRGTIIHNPFTVSQYMDECVKINGAIVRDYDSGWVWFVTMSIGSHIN